MARLKNLLRDPTPAEKYEGIVAQLQAARRHLDGIVQRQLAAEQWSKGRLLGKVDERLLREKQQATAEVTRLQREADLAYALAQPPAPPLTEEQRRRIAFTYTPPASTVDAAALKAVRDDINRMVAREL